MDFPKGFIQKLSILKNNSALFVPIILALVAVILFIPTQLMSSKLKRRMEDESISKMGRQIKSLSASAVSREQWKKEAERQHVYANDANQMALLSKQSTQRELLSYKIFPEPRDTSMLIFKDFSQLYQRAVEELIARVNARDCPTDTELQRGLESSSRNLQRGRDYSYMRMDSFRRSLGVSSFNLSEVEYKIVDEICRERADSISVYANPADLSGYEYWKEYQYNVEIKKAVEDCWYYQLAYWVIEDVFDTIGACNAGSNSVLTSPVKRILSVNFDMGQGRAKRWSGGLYRDRRSAAGATTAEDRPVYIPSTEKALIEPCTGRSCNDDIDVVHFNAVVVVSAKSVFPFMQQLCSAKEHKFSGFSGNEQEQTFKHNQITILECKMRSIDREAPDHKFYYYGEDAVVELNLFCEYIFNKKGYDEIKPESVKEAMKAGDSTERTGRW